GTINSLQGQSTDTAIRILPPRMNRAAQQIMAPQLYFKIDMHKGCLVAYEASLATPQTAANATQSTASSKIVVVLIEEKLWNVLAPVVNFNCRSLKISESMVHKAHDSCGS